MDRIREIITTLGEEDRKEFRLFISRQKNKRHRKDRDLFDLLQQSEERSADAIAARLYPEGNRPAYHALRKRLLRHLMDYMVLKRMNEDPTTASTVMGLLSLAKYLFDQNVDQLAWIYLRKAEKLAEENEQFELLNSIYNLQLEKAHSEHAGALETIIERWRSNKVLADQDERANVAYSLIQKQLKEVRLEGKALDFDRIIRTVLDEYRLTEAMAQRPGLLFRVMSITRSAMLAKKDFYSFEPYIIAHYHRMESAHGFDPRHRFFQLSLLYMIAHVLYRNKRFAESNRYLDQLMNILAGAHRGHYWQFYPRYVLLRAANHTYLGENERSVALLQEILAEPGARLRPEDQLNIQLNLSVYYFQQSSFKASNRVLRDIHHSDRWCEKKMGKEWVLRKNLIEIILQIELGHEDLADNRIRSLLRHFKAFLEQPAYQRVPVFLGYIRKLINNPDKANVGREVFFEKVQEQFVTVPGEREDLLAMGFYAWLKARMIGEQYYDVLLDIVRSVEREEATAV